MGTYISILKFYNMEIKENFKNLLLNFAEAGKTKSYRSLRIRIGEQEFPIELKARFNVQTTFEGNPLISLEIDTPIEVVNLDGVWNVKEKKNVNLFFYEERDLSDIALSISDSSKGVKAFIEAIPYLNLPSPQRIKVKFIRTPDFVSKISQLGSLGWIWLSDVPDDLLQGAGLWGRDLQSHEIVTDLLKRGAEVTALVIVNETKRLRIIISDKGSIYSQQNLQPIVVANELKELIKFFKSSGLFIFE